MSRTNNKTNAPLIGPDTVLSEIPGFGKVYGEQTMCACSGGDTVACLIRQVEPLFDRDNAEEALAEWIVNCARNPSAGKMNGSYLIPQYNMFIAKSIVSVLLQAIQNDQLFDKRKHTVPSKVWVSTLHGALSRLTAGHAPIRDSNAKVPAAETQQKTPPKKPSKVTKVTNFKNSTADAAVTVSAAPRKKTLKRSGTERNSTTRSRKASPQPRQAFRARKQPAA